MTAPNWVCPDPTSDIHHLFASVHSLMKTQVRKKPQQAEPTGSLSIKDSITAMVIQESFLRNLSDNNAQERKFRRKKGLHSSKSDSPRVKNEVPSRQDFLM